MARKLIIISAGIIGSIIVFIIAIQFIPIDHSNPPVIQEPIWDSPQTKMLVERACYDCHSNQTQWPWYSYVAPVSWLVVHDVNEARAELNFSDWQRLQAEPETDEIIEVILKDEMPPPIYRFMHPQARFTSTEKEALIQGLQATLTSSVSFVQPEAESRKTAHF